MFSTLFLGDILETHPYFVIPPWCMKPKIMLDLIYLKKNCTCNFISYYENSRQLDYIPGYTYNSRDGNSVVCASFFPIRP